MAASSLLSSDFIRSRPSVRGSTLQVEPISTQVLFIPRVVGSLKQRKSGQSRREGRKSVNGSIHGVQATSLIEPPSTESKGSPEEKEDSWVEKNGSNTEHVQEAYTGSFDVPSLLPTLGGVILSSLREGVEVLDHNLSFLSNDVSNTPKAHPDEEVVHDLRVALRRLRSSVRAFSGFITLPKRCGNSELSFILGVVGEVRDNDVILEQLLELEKSAGLESRLLVDNIGTAKRILEERRPCLMDGAIAMLRGKQMRNVRDGLLRWLEDPSLVDSEALSTEAATVLPSLLSSDVTAVLLHPAWDIDSIFLTKKGVLSLDIPKSECMHDLRKKIRELRYRMELYSKRVTCSPRFHKAVSQLQHFQGQLGRLQDVQILSDFAAAHKLKALNCKALKCQEEVWTEWLAARQGFKVFSLHARLYRALASGFRQKHSQARV